MDPTKRCDDVNELHPYVKELALKLQKEAKKQGLDMKVIDTYRSKERQDFLYSQGRTRPGSIVTNAKGSDMASYHNWRLAFDCIQNKKGYEYDSKFLNKLGKIGQSIGLEWGGGWSGFKDAPHFQYTFGLSIKDLKNGKKPPEYKPEPPKPPVKDQHSINVDILVKHKIITQPEVWYTLKGVHVDNVKALINNMAKKLEINSTHEKNVDTLVKYKLILQPDAWYTLKNVHVNNVKALINNMANYLEDQKQFIHRQNVNILKINGVLSQPEVWIDLKSVHVDNVKALINNMAKKLEINSTHEKNVDILVKYKLIIQPEVWYSLTKLNLDNVKALINNMANYFHK